jgi:hypothetical protein
MNGLGALGVLLVHEVFGVESFDFTGNAGDVLGGVEPGDPPDTGLTGTQRRPRLLDPDAHRGDQAHTR